MFLIDWFHLYLRNPERRISENLIFYPHDDLRRVKRHPESHALPEVSAARAATYLDVCGAKRWTSASNPGSFRNGSQSGLRRKSCRKASRSIGLLRGKGANDFFEAWIAAERVPERMQLQIAVGCEERPAWL
jgi:hypothetical protein